MTFALLQADANLVLYAEDGRVCWATNTENTANTDFTSLRLSVSNLGFAILTSGREVLWTTSELASTLLGTHEPPPSSDFSIELIADAAMRIANDLCLTPELRHIRQGTPSQIVTLPEQPQQAQKEHTLAGSADRIEASQASRAEEAAVAHQETSIDALGEDKKLYSSKAPATGHQETSIDAPEDSKGLYCSNAPAHGHQDMSIGAPEENKELYCSNAPPAPHQETSVDAPGDNKVLYRPNAPASGHADVALVPAGAKEPDSMLQDPGADEKAAFARGEVTRRLTDSSLNLQFELAPRRRRASSQPSKPSQPPKGSQQDHISAQLSGREQSSKAGRSELEAQAVSGERCDVLGKNQELIGCTATGVQDTAETSVAADTKRPASSTQDPDADRHAAEPGEENRGGDGCSTPAVGHSDVILVPADATAEPDTVNQDHDAMDHAKHILDEAGQVSTP